MNKLFVNTDPKKSVEEQLEDFFAEPEPDFEWTIMNSTNSDGVTYMEVKLTSIRWHGELWKHSMVLIIPDVVNMDGTFLLLDGGERVNGEPSLPHPNSPIFKPVVDLLKKFSKEVGMVMAIQRNLPSTPTAGATSELDYMETCLLEHEIERTILWGSVYPMVKSVMKGFTAVKEICAIEGVTVNTYGPCGLSKRGMTTYLLGAYDNRVDAMSPIVMDYLNFPKSYPRMVELYGQDDMNLTATEVIYRVGAFQENPSPLGKEMITTLDPYESRHRFTVPIYALLGTNDPFFAIDTAKYYIKDLPDTQLAYQMNLGHDFGLPYILAVSAWYYRTHNNLPSPELTWTSNELTNKTEVSVNISTPGYLRANLVEATSATENFLQSTWAATNLNKTTTNFNIEVLKPASGYKAFYIEIVYNIPTGKPNTQFPTLYYTICTRVFLLGS